MTAERRAQITKKGQQRRGGLASSRFYWLDIDPDLFGSFVCWKFPTKTGNSIYLRQLFSFVLLAFLLFASTNNVADAKPTASVVHDIQFILSLKRIYNGPLDGNCSSQTIAAIRRYVESVQEKQPIPIQCSGELLEILIRDVSEVLSSTKATQSLANQQQELAAELGRINLQVPEIGDLKAKFQQMQESHHSELVTQYIQVSALSCTVIAIVVAVLTFAEWNLGKTLIE
jgi:hypothetical protein